MRASKEFPGHNSCISDPGKAESLHSNGFGLRSHTGKPRNLERDLASELGRVCRNCSTLTELYSYQGTHLHSDDSKFWLLMLRIVYRDSFAVARPACELDFAQREDLEFDTSNNCTSLAIAAFHGKP